MQRAVTAIYRTYAVADLVRDEIAELGVSRGYIHVVPDRDDGLAEGTSRDDASYNDDLHGLHLPEDEMRTYQQAVRRGDYVVSANVDDGDDAMLERILEIMRRPEDAYDIDALDEEYRDAEYVPAAGAGMGAAATGMDTGTADRDRTADATRMEGDEQVIPVAEERLRVGKRDVNRGTTHVRAYTREMPVEERVTLRDETVHVERRPASRTMSGTEAETAFQDRTIDVEEHDEEAVVTKEAQVTEEVVVSKDVEVHEETVQDTVRKTEVDVDDSDRRT